MSQSDFEPRRFRSAVPFYARFRLRYPGDLIARVEATVGLVPGDRVLDLGCGPGFLAIPFAEAGMRVTGIDPEPDMLASAEEEAAKASVAVDFKLGSSFDLPRGIGPFRLVTMGRSFHWMDRSATLRILDMLVPESGAVALFEDDHPRTVENGWLAALREVGARYGYQEASRRLAAQKSDYRGHISYLFDSAFSRVVRIGVFVRHMITTDEIIGRAFSLSMFAKEKLGERAVPFETELRSALAPLSPDGRFTEIAEISAIVGMRE